jgi:lipid-A-disaccharide synthase
MIVAGEASGDKHGAALARSLVKLYPETQFEMFGSGDDEMRAAGVETLVDAREVAIIGIPEIAASLGKFYRAYRRLLNAARHRRPDVVVLIDWPDFNLRLARRLHREGMKVVYYISPQVWAWRRYRVRAIRRDVDRMLVILPFEKEFYEKTGVDAEYVGHPLVEAVKATASRKEFCARHGLDPARPIISLLPGSRRKEVHYHLPAMLEAAGLLRDIGDSKDIRDSKDLGDAKENRNAAQPDRAPESCQFALPIASTVDRDRVLRIVGERPGPAEVTLIERDTYNALYYSDFAIIASGTATVEAALAGTPMVIVYRASELNWRLIRPLIHLDTFGMVNLIAGRRIVSELIQHDATGQKIAREVAAILGDAQRLAGMKNDLAEVRQRLEDGGGSASNRAAAAVMKVIGRPVPHHCSL